MTKENTLIGSHWEYKSSVGDENYVPVYEGTWTVSDIHEDRAILKQDTCECAGKEGSPFYVSYSSKKCIEIPISRLQREFKRYYPQNIVAEPVVHQRRNNCCSQKRPAGAPPIMTNRDIQKSIEDRKNTWTDKECDSYIANRKFQKKPFNATGKKTISIISEIFDAAFGESTTNRLLDLLEAGSKFGAIATSMSTPFYKWESSPFAGALREANKEFDAARDAFVREIRCQPVPEGKEKPETPSCRRSCSKGYANDGPCRNQMDYTPEPRCSNFDCEPTIPLKHHRH